MDLQELLKDDDELSCMDKIYIRLEEITNEDDDFMELLVKNFADAQITWEQPWYQEITGCLTRPLKNDEHKDAFRTDALCTEEFDRIKKNWRKLIKKYNIPDKLHCLARWKNKGKCRKPDTAEERARRFVIAYLAQGLNRTLHKVYKHITTHYDGFIKGLYTPEEEKIIEICFKHNPNSAVTMLSKVLKREPRWIYKKLEFMFQGKPVFKKIKWTLPLATKFLRLLLKYSGQTLAELKSKKIDKSVWVKLGDKFDQQYFNLEDFWQAKLHMQIFLKEKVTRYKLRKMIFKKLSAFNYRVWTDIRWKDVAKALPDCYTPRFLYLMAYRTFRRPRINLKLKPLQENIDEAMSRIRTLKRNRNKRLKTLALNENNELEVVYYEHNRDENHIVNGHDDVE